MTIDKNANMWLAKLEALDEERLAANKTQN